MRDKFITRNDLDLAIARSGGGGGDVTDVIYYGDTAHITETVSLIDMFYPVGTLYMTEDSSFDPNVTWGGTWVLTARGRFIIGSSAGNDKQANTESAFGSLNDLGYGFPVSAKGGQYSHQLSIAEMPTHNHEMPEWMWAVSAYFNTGTFNIPSAQSNNGNAIPYNDNKTRQPQYTTTNGGGGTHNNVPPYEAANIWRRTA